MNKDEESKLLRATLKHPFLVKAVAEEDGMKAIEIHSELPRHPRKEYQKRKLSKIKKIVIHTTDRDWTPRQVAEYDIGPNHISSTGCPAITYHEVIMPTGKVYHTLPYKEVSWHAAGHNKDSIAIALSYKATTGEPGVNNKPPRLAMLSLYSRLSALCLRLKITPHAILGHRELKGTGFFFDRKGHKRLRKTCPGLKVDLDKVRKNVAFFMQTVLKIKHLYTGKIDGDFGPESYKALKKITVD